MIPLLVLLPAGAALVGLGVRGSLPVSRAVAVGAALLTALLAVVAVVVVDPGSVATLPGGDLQTGGPGIPLAVGTDGATKAVAVVVALVAAAVQAYAAWYLADDDRYAVFAATVSLFTAAMLLLVHARDLVVLLVGWEVMGWCSFLLIGHWSRRPGARRAAHKAFLVTRLADVGMVLGVVGLSVGAGTTELGAVVGHWTGPSAEPALRAVLMSLVVVGVLGKSAQLPFSDWLPDAMEGPTPASALIHAATMVAAGTVVLALLLPVLALAGPARWLLAVATGLTMVLAALLALAQSDLKRLLAWSTVSQVGIMLAALAAAPPTERGRGGPSAGPGLLHLYSHAIFKSLLFLSLGWLGLLAGGTAARALRGSAWQVPVAGAGFAVGLAGLAGVPLLVGGVSKEHVVEAAWDAARGGDGPARVVTGALLLTVVLTAAYAVRALLVVGARSAGREGSQDVGSPDSATEPADSARRVDGIPTDLPDASPDRAPEPGNAATVGVSAPPAVRVVVAVLAVLTVLGGLVTLTGAFDLPGFSVLWALVTLLLVALGAAAAWLLGRGGDLAERLPARLVTAADDGLGADRAYLAVVARPVLGLARLVAFLDREVVDGYVAATGLAARAAGGLGARASRPERPSVGLGLLAVGLLGALAVGVLAWS
ncbi:MAG TPA: proton-conducting transporter membrane subunit [Dermatophilaceae bacterium]|nr:proton-conducting transporter membrane subunit [Dermatophilaceae bacterium]